MIGTPERLNGEGLDLPTSVPVVWGAAGLLLAYLGSVALQPSLPALRFVQLLIGPVLVLVVPGALLTGIVDVGTESVGRFLLFAVATSLTLLAAVTILMSVSLPTLGVRRPLSVLRLAAAVSVVIVALLTITDFRPVTLPPLRTGLGDSIPTVVLLVALPVVAAAAATAMGRWQRNVGMFLFVGLVVVVVLLSTTRRFVRSLYPPALFLLALSALFHRNLLTNGIVGADVQLLYAVSRHVLAVGSWSPNVAETAAAIPVVSAAPAAVSLLTGVSVATTFKVLYVFVFSLVPVGVYYVGRTHFDDDVAFYGAVFFLFYHVSFFFTPGKQLISELFVVLILLTLWSDGQRAGRVVALAVLSLGLVQSHYGMTFVFGLALLAAAVGLAVGRRLVDGLGPPLPIGYPVLLLVGATAWYAYASRALAIKLATIPVSTLGQVWEFLLLGVIPGSGASYLNQGTSTVETLQLVLYVVFSVLIVVGLAARSFSHLTRLRSGSDPDRVGLTTLALPMFAFLGASYVLVFDLWADRAYQLALTILAPFAAYGFGRASEWVAERRVSPSAPILRPRWFLFAVLLGSLFAFNTGAVAAVAGTAGTSAFDADAHDLVFSDEERAGAEWIERRPGVSRTEPTSLPPGQRHTVDVPERVQIYTDSTSVQLFRAVLPEHFYDVEVVELKNEWQPTMDPSGIEEGYVYVRKASVREAPEGGTLPPSYLSPREVEELETTGEVVYENEDVVVLRVPGGDEG